MKKLIIISGLLLLASCQQKSEEESVVNRLKPKVKNTSIKVATVGIPESEIKTLLTESSYKNLVDHLDDQEYDYKGKYQENYYIDMDNFVLKYNGINVRIRITDKKKATLTIKDSNKRNKTDPFDLKGKSLSEKNEYECKFKELEQAEKVIAKPSLITDVTKKICKTKKSSFNGIHPVDFLKNALKQQELYSPNNSEQERVQLSESLEEFVQNLENIGANSNARKKVKVKFSGHKLKMEVDKTIFANGSIRFGVDLDISKVKDEKAREKIAKEFFDFISSFGSPAKLPLGGKTTLTFIIAQDDEETVKKLYENGDLID